MPNWVENKLAIHKKHKDILLNENGELDFGKLLPMPESLNITSGGHQREAVALYLYKERGEAEKLNEIFESYKNSNPGSEIKNVGEYADHLEEEYRASFTKLMENPNAKLEYKNERAEEMKKFPTLASQGEVYVTNKEKYGAETWYEWRNLNWGCKWNASESYVEETGDLLEISFNTPWGPPSGWLEKLSEAAPFYLEWIEEQGYHGEFICDAKKSLVDNDLPFFRYEEEMPADISEEDAESWYDDDHYLSDDEIAEQYMFDNMKESVIDWENEFEEEYEQDFI